MSYYRTRTYVAGDWDGDKNLIEKLYQWNESECWSLCFSDAHSLMQSRDTSLPCSIKKSLAERMSASKTLLLVVGENTDSIKKGSCQYCDSYNGWTHSCAKGHSIDYRSYIHYECEKAQKDGLNIIVVYNYEVIVRSKCPGAVRYIGDHINGYYKGDDGIYYWNYDEIKKAIEKY